MGTSFHLEKNDIKHFKLKPLLRIGVWNVSVTSIDVKSQISMFYFSYVFGIDIMTLKKTVKDIMLHRFTTYEEHYWLNDGIPYKSVDYIFV